MMAVMYMNMHIPYAFKQYSHKYTNTMTHRPTYTHTHIHTCIGWSKHLYSLPVRARVLLCPDVGRSMPPPPLLLYTSQGLRYVHVCMYHVCMYTCRTKHAPPPHCSCIRAKACDMFMYVCIMYVCIRVGRSMPPSLLLYMSRSLRCVHVCMYVCKCTYTQL
jgi:hypothetical protein